MSKKIITVIIYIFTLTLLVHGVALAAMSDEAQKRQELRTQRCELLTQRTDAHINRYENNRVGHVNAFTNIKERLERLITRLQERGYDTDKLKEDVEILGMKIDKLSQDLDLFIEKLREAKNYTCGESEGAFAEAMRVARDQLKIVREDVRDIKTFYRNTIKPDILAIRAQNPESSAAKE